MSLTRPASRDLVRRLTAGDRGSYKYVRGHATRISKGSSD